MPELSAHYRARRPSPIRRAQILALARPDRADLEIVNLAIGNVSLPLHPALRARLGALDHEGSPFAGGVVRYSPTAGTEEAARAFLRVLESAGAPTEGLACVVTDGGSAAMELTLLGTLGPAGERPLLLLDPAYSNYNDFARRIGCRTVAVPRELGERSRYRLPDRAALERVIERERPAALLVIPADNPTGQLLRHEELVELARVAVAHDLWLVSDEAYRQLGYVAGAEATTIWSVTEAEAPGIRGRRIGIESASKVWNACGLRVGALVTDSPAFHAAAVAEYTANLCANVIGQWIFGALAHETDASLRAWYGAQRDYYAKLMQETVAALRAAVPGMIVSEPEAALYSVLELGGVVPGFDAERFVTFCAERGRVPLDGKDHTLLLAPMSGFFAGGGGSTQLRIAYVEGAETMRKVPRLLALLLERFVRDR